VGNRRTNTFRACRGNTHKNPSHPHKFACCLFLHLWWSHVHSALRASHASRRFGVRSPPACLRSTASILRLLFKSDFLVSRVHLHLAVALLRASTALFNPTLVFRAQRASSSERFSSTPVRGVAGTREKTASRRNTWCTVPTRI